MKPKNPAEKHEITTHAARDNGGYRHIKEKPDMSPITRSGSFEHCRNVQFMAGHKIAIGFSSANSVPAAAPGAMSCQVASVCKCFNMILDRVAVGASGFHCFGHGDAPATAAQL